MPSTIPAVLSIAGSDSGGGAGIQADLKAFARCGVHGMTAITALTAQSTVGVTGVHPVPGEFIVQQVRTVAEDMGVDAVKIGMLGSAATVAAVRQALELLDNAPPIVIDPVMVAESGAVLLDDEARAAMIELLFPLATVITPNLPEARVLAGRREIAPRERADTSEIAPRERADTREDAPRERADTSEIAPRERDAEELARSLHALGPENVVVTGGHREEATDVFFDGSDITLIPGPRHPDGAAHGSGCTHSSALAAHLALGYSPREAAERARVVASEAVRAGLREIGRGAGPVDVFDLTSRAKQSPAHAELAR